MEEWGQRLTAEISSPECTYDKVKLLLEKGVDPCVRYGAQSSAVFICVEKNDHDLLRVLLAYASTGGLEQINDEGLTPLMSASKLGHGECVDALISVFSGKPDAINLSVRGNTALLLACSEGHNDIARALLQAGADSNARDSKGRCPAHVSAVRGNLELLKQLRRFGAVLDVRDDHGNTPMHFCAHTPVIEYLHREGLDPSAKNDQGSTPCDILERLQVNPAVIGSLKALESPLNMKRGLLQHMSARRLLDAIVDDLGWKAVVFVLIVIAVIAWQIAVYMHGGSPFPKYRT